MTKKLYKHIGIFVDKVCTGTEKKHKKKRAEKPSKNFIVQKLFYFDVDKQRF